MDEIKFRLAKPCDAKQIAECHWHVRDRYSNGIFLSLGKSFLKTYYKIILNDPNEVVVCGVITSGKIVGFSNATLDASAQVRLLKKHKFRLGFSALGALICHPKLIKEVWLRYKSLDKNHNLKFVNTEGVRAEYWCWLKNYESDLKSIEVDLIKSNILFDLGCKEIFYEVDKTNKQVYKYHVKIIKAEPIEEIKLPDGRVRVLFKKKLKHIDF